MTISHRGPVVKEFGSVGGVGGGPEYVHHHEVLRPHNNRNDEIRREKVINYM